MKHPRSSLILSLTIVAIAAAPAVATDDGGFVGAVSFGGSMALVGVALVGIGALLLTRSRNHSDRRDSDAALNTEGTAGGATLADHHQPLSLANTGSSDSSEVGTGSYHVRPGIAEAIHYRGGVLASASTGDTAAADTTSTQLEPESDEIAQQMLEAIKAERARRRA